METTMRMVPILKSMVLGAVDGGMDVVGNAAFPIVWPAVRKAIDPVLNKLREKLNGRDPLDELNKENALALFDQDEDLQAMLEDKLQAVVSEVRSVSTGLNEGQERLLQIAQGNSETIEKLADIIHVQTTTLFVKGVRIAAESKQELVELFEERQRSQAARMQKVRDDLDGQISRINARCVELISEGQHDRAEEELEEGLRLLNSRLEDAPGDAHLEVQLAYMLKTGAQQFLRTGEAERGNRFNEAALRLFRHIAYGISLARKSVQDYISAINGIGNIQYSLGHYRTAIQNYTMATQIVPKYFYAWHDLFGAYYELGKIEPPNLSAMRRALDMMWETGKGKPGLGEKSLNELELRYQMIDPEYILNDLIGMCISAYPTLKDLCSTEKVRDDNCSSDPVLELADAQTKSGFKKDAIKTYESILAAYDKGTEKRNHIAAVAANKLGLIYSDDLDNETAEKRFRQALDLVPTYPEPWYNLGDIDGSYPGTTDEVPLFLRGALISKAQGNLPFSAKCLGAAAFLDLFDEDKQMLKGNLRGGVPRVLHGLGDYNLLAEFCHRVIKEALMFGHLNEAEQWLPYTLECSRKSRIRNNEAVTYQCYGEYYEGQGKNKEAIQSYTRAIEIFKEVQLGGEAVYLKSKIDRLKETKPEKTN